MSEVWIGDEARTFLSWAIAHAEAGYHVIPLWPRNKCRRTPAGTAASADLSHVRDWWRRWPDSNVGVVISDLPVMVLDVDGPLGEVSLQTLLDQAGSTALPETYTVTTGRADGGRHLWYRLTDQQEKLVNQLGAHYPQTPHLDVLFQGLVVGAGSLHKTGATYVSCSSLPPPSELAELPMMLFQPLARRGKRRDESGARTRPKKTRKSAPAAQGPAVVAPEGFTPPPAVQTLLADRSDGRNGRTLQAVTPLVRLGWPVEVILNTVLASPLGSKAKEQRHPKWWIRQKIETARGHITPELDKHAYLWAVHTSGMSPAKMRVLDGLLTESTPQGVVTQSQAWIGIDAAVGSAAGTLRDLIRDGWLVVLHPGTPKHAATYRLRLLQEGVDEKYHPHVGPLPPLPQWSFGVGFPVCHDAFRCKQGSLHSAYPMLTLLGPQPQPVERLADLLRLTTPRSVKERLTALRSAGLAVQTPDGVSLTTQPIPPLLDAAAVRAGTAGDRRRAIEDYQAKAAAWQERQWQLTIVGSGPWLDMLRKDVTARMKKGQYDPILEVLGPDVEAAIDVIVKGQLEFAKRLETGCPRLAVWVQKMSSEASSA